MATTTKKSGGTVYQTGKKEKKIDIVKKGKKKLYKTTSAHEVKTKDGNRWYEGEATSSRIGMSGDKARLRALAKVHSNPSDSLVTGGKDPDYTKKAKKKKFWQK